MNSDMDDMVKIVVQPKSVQRRVSEILGGAAVVGLSGLAFAKCAQLLEKHSPRESFVVKKVEGSEDYVLATQTIKTGNEDIGKAIASGIGAVFSMVSMSAGFYTMMEGIFEDRRRVRVKTKKKSV